MPSYTNKPFSRNSQSCLIINIGGVNFNHSGHWPNIRCVGAWHLDVRDVPRLVVQVLDSAVRHALTAEQRQELRESCQP